MVLMNMRRANHIDPRFMTAAPVDEDSQLRPPVRPNYPRHRLPWVPNDASPHSPEWWDRAHNNLLFAMEGLATLLVDESNRVDEYRPQSLQGESATNITWQADYKGSEIIEAIVVTGPAAASGVSQSNTHGIATPAGGANIVTVNALVPGLYTVEWSVEVEGAAATLVDNYKLLNGGALVATAEQGTAIGQYPQQQQLINIPAAGQAVVIQTISTETTATINGQITLVPYQGNSPFTLVLGRRTWSLALPSTGILVISPIKMSLAESNTRQLTSSIAGDWAVELMGITDTGRIGRPGSV